MTWTKFGLISSVLAGATIIGLSLLPAQTLNQSTQRESGIEQGFNKIKHIIVIMQENRSFDSYFGTYPGADGIPVKNGEPIPCLPDPKPARASNRFTTRMT